MTKSLPDRVSGASITLRLILPEDAEYVYDLRKDATYNQYLSDVTGTVEDQSNWIKAYKSREAQGLEGYYVIERRDDGTRCGLIRIYDVAQTAFTWGSWILDANKPAKAALESAVLSFGIAFRDLELTEALIEVDAANTHAAAFYRRFGMSDLGRKGDEFTFRYTRADYEADYPRHAAILGLAG